MNRMREIKERREREREREEVRVHMMYTLSLIRCSLFLFLSSVDVGKELIDCLYCFESLGSIDIASALCGGFAGLVS